MALATILVTVLIFLAVVWTQGLKVEIPLSYDRLRGYGVKWPLAFFYASVLPVILVAALAANVQLFGSLMESWLGRATILGGFSNGQPISSHTLDQNIEQWFAEKWQCKLDFEIDDEGFIVGLVVTGFLVAGDTEVGFLV